MARRSREDEDLELVELVSRHVGEIGRAWSLFPYAVLVRSTDRELVFGLERSQAENYANPEQTDPFLVAIGDCVRRHARNSQLEPGLPLFVLRQRGRRNSWRSNVLHSLLLSRGGDA